MSYSLYTFHTPNTNMMATIPIVIYGLFRYILLTNSGNIGGEPELLFKDKGIIACVIMWFIVATIATLWYHGFKI
jgi:ABC-type tungstate transport system substrate-binding protein